MKVGDLVKVRLKRSPHIVNIGIVIKEPRRMYMVGDVLEVMIDGTIMYVKKEHVELAEKE